MKILIVDDSSDARAVAQAQVASDNIDTFAAEGGIAGLEAAKSEKPDLILLDVNMPDMSGFDVFRALRADPELCTIPVIFLLSPDGVEERVKCLDLGAVDYVIKPFDAIDLQMRVRVALRTKHFQDLLVEQSFLDPLTGMPNQRAFMKRLRQEWSRARRHSGALSLIMAGVDHFKQIGDTYGYALGEVVLQEVGRVLAAECRETDVPARYGSEEFSILVPHTSALHATRLAERCRRRIEGLRIPAGNETVLVTISLGVVDSQYAISQEALFKSADDALHKAQEEGGNRAVVTGDVLNEWF